MVNLTVIEIFDLEEKQNKQHDLNNPKLKLSYHIISYHFPFLFFVYKKIKERLKSVRFQISKTVSRAEEAACFRKEGDDF